MANIPALKNWTAGEIVTDTDLNSIGNTIRTYFNSYAVQTDVNTTITAAHTFTPTQTFTGGLTAGANITVTAGGLTVTGNSTLTGTLSGVTALTITDDLTLNTAGKQVLLVGSSRNASIRTIGASLELRDATGGFTWTTLDLGTGALTHGGAFTAASFVVSDGTSANLAFNKTGGSALNARWQNTGTAVALSDVTNTRTPFSYTPGTNTVAVGGTTATIAGVLTVNASGLTYTGGAHTFGGLSIGNGMSFTTVSTASVVLAMGGTGWIQLGSARATGDNNGFVTINACAGVPSGAPTGAPAGTVPIVYDTTNSRLYVYNTASSMWVQV